MAFPRLLSLAERGWHRAGWEPPDGMDMAAPIVRAALDADWERFANTLGHKELLELEQAGIAFRIDVPGARIVDGRLEANVATPGLGIEYRDEAGNFVPYDPAAPPALGATEVRAVTASGRAGRAVSVP
jgi:hexosaminidase